MNRYYYLFLAGLCGLFACQNPSLPDTATAPYAPWELTGVSQLLGEHWLSDQYNQRDFALSPDGQLMCYTLTGPKSFFSVIVGRKRTDEGWSEPFVLPFSGNYRDLEPAFHPDGSTLYFASSRPLTGHGDPQDFVDLWSVEYQDGQWGTPLHLGNQVNRERDDFFPSVAANGNLYFTAAYEDAIGKEDIYVSKWQNGAYQPPVPLGGAINSEGYEFNAFIAPDESYLIFTAYGRTDDRGRGDLYISFQENGQWTSAQNLGPRVNSAQLDYCPSVSPDGKALYFTSERYAITTHFNEGISYEKFVAERKRALNGQGNLYGINFETVRASLRKE